MREFAEELADAKAGGRPTPTSTAGLGFCSRCRLRRREDRLPGGRWPRPVVVGHPPMAGPGRPLPAGLGRPVPRGTGASAWVTDHLLPGVPLL
ncbi:hypothetical protein GCM10027168_41850 [Streptomyces capparidis]